MEFTPEEKRVMYRALGDLLDFLENAKADMTTEHGVAACIEEIGIIENLIERI